MKKIYFALLFGILLFGIVTADAIQQGGIGGILRQIGVIQMPTEEQTLLQGNNLSAFDLSGLNCNRHNICFYQATSQDNGQVYTNYLNRNNTEYDGLDDDGVIQVRQQEFLDDMADKIVNPADFTPVSQMNIGNQVASPVQTSPPIKQKSLTQTQSCNWLCKITGGLL